jgi:hypothetical protein
MLLPCAVLLAEFHLSSLEITYGLGSSFPCHNFATSFSLLAYIPRPSPHYHLLPACESPWFRTSHYSFGYLTEVSPRHSSSCFLYLIRTFNFMNPFLYPTDTFFAPLHLFLWAFIFNLIPSALFVDILLCVFTAFPFGSNFPTYSP